MIALKPKLKFKEIGVDANERDQERELEDQQRWEDCFQVIVVNYIENSHLQHFDAKEFDAKKDQLDVFVHLMEILYVVREILEKEKEKLK